MKLSTLGFGLSLALFIFGITGCNLYFLEQGRDTPLVQSDPAPSSFSSDGMIIRGQAPSSAPVKVVPVPPSKMKTGSVRNTNPLRGHESGSLSLPQARTSPVVEPATYNHVPAQNNRAGQRVNQTVSFEDTDDFALDSPDPNDFAGFPEPVVSPSGQPQPLPAPALEMAENPGDSLANADPFAASITPNAAPPTQNAVSQTPFAPMPLESAPAAPVEQRPHPLVASTKTPPPVTTPEQIQEPLQRMKNSNTNINDNAQAFRSNDEGTGSPGPAVLEGTQTPHLTLEKVLPAEIVVEQPATIKMVLKNTGRSTVRDIVVRDRIPQGTRLLSTSPEARMEGDQLFWSLGHLDGSEQLTVEMRIIPLREGEIGSVASVNYSAEASSRINVTRPKLQVDVKAPQEIRLGEIANVEITISNPGTATARGVILEEYVPDGLYHKDGKVLVNKNIDTLKPKEAKKLTLPLTCTGAGLLVNRLVVKANGNLRVEEKTSIRALAPDLKLEITGPKQRFLERKSGYRLTVSNSGNASARNVDLVLKLPTAVRFVSTNQSGIYESATHSVHWALEELPAQEAGEIELIVLPSKIGNYTMTFTGVGQNNLKAETAHQVAIDGISALSFDVSADNHLVELGKEIVYEIRVANKGTKGAGNVRIRASLSDGMSFIRADGPVRHQSQGSVVQFEPISQLDSKDEKVFKIAAKCLADGDHRVSVQIISDDLSAPLTKEESVRIFQ